MTPIAFLTGFGVTAAFMPQWQLGAVSMRWALLSLWLPVLVSIVVLRDPRLMRRLWLALVTIVLALASLAWTPVIQDGVGALPPLFAIAFAAVWASTLKDATVKALWYGVVVGLIPSLIIGMLELIGHSPWMSFNTGATGLFVSRLVYGEVAALAFTAALVYRLPWVWIVPLLCMTEISLVGGSREMGLAVIVGGLALLIQRAHPAIPRAGIAMWAGVFLVISVLGLMVFRIGTVSLRFQVWSDVINNLRWSGWGLGSFDQMYSLIATRSTLISTPGHVHNDFLELAFELGLLALPIFAVVALALTRWTKPEWPLLCAFMVMLNVSFPSHLPVTALLLGVILGRLVLVGVIQRRYVVDGGHGQQPGLEPVDRTAGNVGLGSGVAALPVERTGTNLPGAASGSFVAVRVCHFCGGITNRSQRPSYDACVAVSNVNRISSVPSVGRRRLCVGRSVAVQYASC